MIWIISIQSFMPFLSTVDGFFGGVGYKNGKPIQKDVIEATKRMVLIELDFTES